MPTVSSIAFANRLLADDRVLRCFDQLIHGYES
jgi:hypothetical protein